MKNVLVTGGTVFVSRYIAERYVKKGFQVYVLNRNTKPQSDGVHLIQADRHNLLDELKQIYFDMVIDTGYSGEDVKMLLDALGGYGDYIFISSSAVYSEYEEQPFKENCRLAENKFWGKYGTDKINAEEVLLKENPNAYILRPPYLYGPMNNVYREAFVFECAMKDRKFYLPKDGLMKLHFFYIKDLCNVIDSLLEVRPERHIFNVGNGEVISIRDWVDICYKVTGKEAEFVEVFKDVEQRNYFSFYNYEYRLDVSEQQKYLLRDTIPLEEGLKEAFDWYKNNADKVSRKNFLEYIDNNL